MEKFKNFIFDVNDILSNFDEYISCRLNTPEEAIEEIKKDREFIETFKDELDEGMCNDYLISLEECEKNIKEKMNESNKDIYFVCFSEWVISPDTIDSSEDIMTQVFVFENDEFDNNKEKLLDIIDELDVSSGVYSEVEDLEEEMYQ